MLPPKIKKLISENVNKTFLAINFGCRVNAAETNQLSQLLINSGFVPTQDNPGIVIVNTCSVTKKGDIESRGKINNLSRQFPNAIILATGCARLEKIKSLSNIVVISNLLKEKILHRLKGFYSSSSPDTLTRHQRFQLKIQSGCTAFCSYCIVPSKRQELWSLPINDAVQTVNRALAQGFNEIIITGINLNQYRFGFSALIEALLAKTSTPLISFGSIPPNCIDNKFIYLLSTSDFRLSNFLHIPIQSGSDKILKLMRRPCNRQRIIDTFTKIKSISPLDKGGTKGGFRFGTDIIVGFPGETDQDFNETFGLCKSIAFTKIHVFRFSPRPGTVGRQLFDQYPKIPQSTKRLRSRLIRSLISQTTPPSHRIRDRRKTLPVPGTSLSPPR